MSYDSPHMSHDGGLGLQNYLGKGDLVLFKTFEQRILPRHGWHANFPSTFLKPLSQFYGYEDLYICLLLLSRLQMTGVRRVTIP